MRSSAVSTAAVATLLLTFGAVSSSQTPAGAEEPLCTGTDCAFLSPTGAIHCAIRVADPQGNPDGAACAWGDGERAHSVTLLPSGELRPCLNLAAQDTDRCESEPAEGLPRLGYGETAALGPFSCLADAEGITCTVVEVGRGFAINSAGILPVRV